MPERRARTALRRLLLWLPLLAVVSCVSPAGGMSHRAHRLDAALRELQAAWEGLPPDGAAGAERTAQYGERLEDFLQALNRHSPPPAWTGTQSVAGWSVTFAGDPQGLESIPPSWCRSISTVEPAKPLPGLRGERVAGAGIGLPVIMHQPRVEGAADRFVPLNGRFHPATLTAEFTASRGVTLTFHHTRKVRAAALRGTTRPLAFDVSAAVAAAMPRRFFRRYALRGLLAPEEDLAVASIYAPEPFDPEKIPVVLVHGIDSAPHIWANVMNEMAADPVLSRRCQAWYFLYPTGLGIHEAAARLRSTLTEARDCYDPRRRSAAMSRTVLAGHSLGGLLCKMQIMDSGQDLHYAFWTRPLKDLPLSEETRGVVEQSLHFRRVPFVSRAVFIATPHRGSEVTDISMMRLLFKLGRPPRIVTGLVREMSSVARAMVNPRLHRFETYGVRSSEGLSPHHPLLEALNRRPLLAPHDNIIAIFPPMSFGKPREESTDGVVPWSSAALPGAESTSSITAFHSCITDPELAEKLLTVLRRHLATAD